MIEVVAVAPLLALPIYERDMIIDEHQPHVYYAVQRTPKRPARMLADGENPKQLSKDNASKVAPARPIRRGRINDPTEPS